MIYTCFRVLCIVIFMISILPRSVHAQEEPIPEDEALRVIAEEYAEVFAVDVEEAIERLQRQSAIGDLQYTLSKLAPDSFVALWTEHDPVYKIVIKTLPEGERDIREYIEELPLYDLIEIETDAISLTTLRETRERVMDDITEVSMRVDSDIGVKTGKIQLLVVEREQFDRELQEQEIELPELVEVVTVEQLVEPHSDIYGGLSLGECTSGFSVQHYEREKGVTTAGHCDNNVTFDNVSLTYEDGQFSGNVDLQWHTSPNFTVQPWIEYPYGHISIPRTEARVHQTLGEYVCKYGRVTQLTCGEITSKKFWVGIPGGGADQWIKVTGPSGISAGGDSGAPVFTASTAFGTLFGGNGVNEMTYMPVDFFDDLELSVYTGNETYLPDLRNSNGWVSNITIRNDAAYGKRVKVIYLDTDGDYVTDSQDVCYIDGFGFCTVTPPSSFTGSGIVDDSIDVSVVVEQRHSNQRSAYTGIQPDGQGDPNWEEAGTDLHLPYVYRNYYGYNTDLKVFNTGASSTNVTVTYHNNAGGYQNQHTHTLAAGDSISFNPNTGNNFYGSAHLTASEPIVALADHTNTNIAISTQASDGVYSAWLPYVMKNYAGWDSCFVMRNLSGSSANISVTYHYAGGSYTDSKTVSGNAMWTSCQQNLPGSVPNGALSAVISSNQQMAVAINQSNTAAGKHMSYNAVERAAYKVSIPVIHDSVGGWASGIQIQNADTAAGTATVKFYDSGGVLKKTVTTPTIQPGKAYAYYIPNISGLPDGYTYSAVVTSSKKIVIAANATCNNCGGDEVYAYNGVSH